MFAAPLHQEAMPQIVVRIADDQMAWLESQTRPFHTKSDVVRDLIHTAAQGLTPSANLGISTPGEITSKAVTSSKKTFNKRINTPLVGSLAKA